MKLLSKFVVILLSVSLIVSCFSGMKVSNANDEKKLKNIMCDDIDASDYSKLIDFSELWIECHLPETAELTNITKILNVNEELYGYELTFADSCHSYGYVIIEACSTEPIVDFSFSGNDIHTSLRNYYHPIVNQKSSSSTSEETNVLYLLSPFNYATTFEVDGKNVIADSSGCVRTKETVLVKTSESSRATNSTGAQLEDGIVDRNKIALHSYNTISGASTFVPSVMGNMPAHSSNGSGLAGAYGEGNCAPTNLTNIVAFHKEKRNLTNLLINNSRDASYNRLSSLVGYHPSSGTFWWNYGGALTQYCSERGYSCSVNSYLLDSWEDFVRDINADLPILMSVRGYQGTMEVGHAMTGVGWASSYSGTKYIRVIDNWNNHTNRYIMFKSEHFTSFEGCSVEIYV